MPVYRYSRPETDPPRTVLHEILDRGQFSPETRKKYRNVINRWIAFAGTDPNNWTRRTFALWRDELIRQQLTQDSIETYIASIRYVAKWWATMYERTDFTVIQPIEIPTPGNKERQAPSPEEVKRLLETCIDGRPDLFDHRDLVLMIVGFETGMRRESLAKMEWDKIGLLSEGPAGPYPSADVPVKGPGGKQRFKVPLSDLALEALDSWRAASGVKHGAVFRRLIKSTYKTGPHKGRTYVKIGPSGLSGTAIWDIFAKRGAKARLRMYPHLVRHAFVTWRALENVDLWLIASVTGHAMEALAKVNIGKIERYLSVERAGELGRKTTPPWFAQLARKLLKEF